jgi:alanine dehydrogenase
MQMQVGVPREIKDNEFRVGLTPESVTELVHAGHRICVESGAGDGIGAHDDVYRAAGAEVLEDAASVFAAAEMIVKVKEPQAVERAMLRNGQILFTYLHLAPDPEQTRDLVNSGSVCIAYETVTGPHGDLPLLKPMSQVAGRMAVQAGATALEKSHGGRGVLLSGVSGVQAGRVVIIGGGTVGFNAAQMAVGLQSDVCILDRNPYTLQQLDDYFQGRARVLYSNAATLREEVARADLVIGAVLIPGAAAPKLVTREMLASMHRGAVLVDVAIDQGGCFETSHPTTHSQPTFVVDDVVHYCVANMPGGVARTSTYALNNATLPHVLALANKGWRAALTDDAHLLEGLNVCAGKVTCEPVASALGYPYAPAREVLAASAP